MSTHITGMRRSSRLAALKPASRRRVPGALRRVAVGWGRVLIVSATAAADTVAVAHSSERPRSPNAPECPFDPSRGSRWTVASLLDAEDVLMNLADVGVSALQVDVVLAEPVGVAWPSLDWTPDPARCMEARVYDTMSSEHWKSPHVHEMEGTMA